VGIFTRLGYWAA